MHLNALTQGQAAALIGVTPRALREWHDAPRNRDGTYPGPALVAYYVERVTGSGDFDDQRQRLAAAQSEKIERDNAVRRGELIERKDADRFWSDCISNARARMLAVGAKLGPRLVNIGDANLIAASIRAEVSAGLGELVEYDPEPGECAGVGSGSVEAVGAAADPDGERVERPRAKAVNGKQRRARTVAD